MDEYQHNRLSRGLSMRMDVAMCKYYLIIILILAGCSPSSGLETTTVTPTTFLPTVVPSTAIMTIAPTLAPTSTTIPSQPISTPIAKKDPDITLELLRTNNGCDLPCWWGIIPNETRWRDAKKLLNSFSEIYERPQSNDWLIYEVYSPLAQAYSEVHAVRTVYATQQEVVKEMDVSGFNEETYRLSTFLLNYGMPSQVLVSTYSSDYGLPPNQVPLSIDLYYPEKGINALYGTSYGAYAIIEGDQIVGCLSKSPTLFLWSPKEHNRSIDYILGWDKRKVPYLSIEKATKLDIQAFYEKYSDPDNPPCLETPTSLWSSQ